MSRHAISLDADSHATAYSCPGGGTAVSPLSRHPGSIVLVTCIGPGCIAEVHMQVKEEELRKVLAPAGFVWELTVPRNPDGASFATDLPSLQSSLVLFLPLV